VIHRKNRYACVVTTNCPGVDPLRHKGDRISKRKINFLKEETKFSLKKHKAEKPHWEDPPRLPKNHYEDVGARSDNSTQLGPGA